MDAGRVRRAGAGRPRLTESDPGVVAALEALVDPGHARGSAVAVAVVPRRACRTSRWRW